MIDQDRLDKCFESVLTLIRSQREETAKEKAKEKEYFWNDEAQTAQLKSSLSDFLSQDDHQLADSIDFYQKILMDVEGKVLTTQDRVKFQAFFLTVGEYLGGEPLLVEQNTKKMSSKVVCLNVKKLIDEIEPPKKAPERDDGTVYLCNLPYCKGRRSKSVMEYTFPNGAKKTLYKSDKNKKNFFRHIGSHYICVSSNHKGHYVRDLRLLKVLLPKYILTAPKVDVGNQPNADDGVIGDYPNSVQDEFDCPKGPLDIVRDVDYELVKRAFMPPQKYKKSGDWFHIANKGFDPLLNPSNEVDKMLFRFGLK